MKRDMQRAIRYFCFECVGFDQGFRQLVDSCTSKSCPLFPFRFGKDPSPNAFLQAYSQGPEDWAKMRRGQSRKDWDSTQGMEAIKDIAQDTVSPSETLASAVSSDSDSAE